MRRARASGERLGLVGSGRIGGQSCGVWSEGSGVAASGASSSHWGMPRACAAVRCTCTMRARLALQVQKRLPRVVAGEWEASAAAGRAARARAFS